MRAKRQLPQADAEGCAVRQEKEQRQQRRAAEITQDHDGQGIPKPAKARLGSP